MARRPTVLFVCLHGAAKSVIAAAHLRRLAAERGLAVDVVSAGVEPDAEIPARVREGLAADGLDAAVQQPEQVSAEMVAAARHTVSFGCEIPIATMRHNSVEYWTDIPAVSDDYDAALRAIVSRLPALLDRIECSLGADATDAPPRHG